jgi:hypothetical protein
MSNEGRTSYSPTATDGILSAEWVARRKGSTADYLKRYRMLAADAVARRLAGLEEVAPDLLDLISDERTLYTAWQHMSAHGSGAPGPDGDRYDDFSFREVWSWCRATRDEIRTGQYVPSCEEVRRIPKGGGRGFRELVLQSIFDRVVHRAVVEVLQPLLDPLFDGRSFGYRPKRGPLRALATAEKLYHGGRRGVWVSVDVRNAFPSVPVGRLAGVLRGYLPDGRLLAFLGVLTKEGVRPGLRQGSPLSPLLLNLYLHHLVDRKWRELFPGVPLLRFADDILLLCQSAGRAAEAYAALAKLVQDAGLALKEGPAEATVAVGQGGKVEWMGYGIAPGVGALAYTVTDGAWNSLCEQFTAAHAKPNSPIAAVRSLSGWVADKGPCFPHTALDLAYDRIGAMAAEQGFEEILERCEVRDLWQRAYARWCKLRKKLGGQ